MKEFEEFLTAKKAKEKEETDAEDFEIEIGDKDGNFVRTRRSHAKPFLNRMGIDVDAPAETEPTEGGTKPKPKPKSNTPQQSTVRKYFTTK
jgi:hypothetical protein